MKAKIVIAIAALGLAGLAAARLLPGLLDQAPVAAGYAARMVCSCQFVGGRALESCKADLEPGMEWVWVQVDAKAGTVTAWLPLLASRTARHTAGFGCTLDAP